MNNTETSMLRDELLSSLKTAVSSVVPRFLEQMSADYFSRTERETQLFHLKAIVAAEASGLSQDLLFRSEDGLQFTLVTRNNYPGQLHEVLGRLPRDRPLYSAEVYTSKDEGLIVDVFDFREPQLCSEEQLIGSPKYQKVMAEAATCCSPAELEEFRKHLALCSERYFSVIHAEQLIRNFNLVQEVHRSGNATVALSAADDGVQAEIVVGFTDISRRRLFKRITRYLARIKADIRQAQLEGFHQTGTLLTSLLHFAVVSKNGRPSPFLGEAADKIRQDILRLIYADDLALELFYSSEGLTLSQAELLGALARLCHQKLVIVDNLRFSNERIVSALIRQWPSVREIVDIACKKFAVEADRSAEEIAAAISECLRRLSKAGITSDDKRIISTLLEIVSSIYKTNFNVAQKHALCFRLDPGILPAHSPDKEQPYGVFFCHGRGFDAFHVRFRDIARGGMRIVQPRSTEEYIRESERHYEEAYRLAYAQQLKNKDIPEGGSKAVILAGPGHDAPRAARQFVDGLLDLIVDEPIVQSQMRDYLNENEIIYLGPDENVSDELISWCISRADKRGYPLAQAFMSSKPRTGINHRAFGVTSEGVNVYLETALQAMGIDPRTQPFTVKITGGPDGDVAGNQLKILAREYGSNAKVAGIADISGCAEDRDGLCQTELLRLVELGLPIADFDESKLGPSGRKVLADCPDGILQRNSLHNRVVAEAFIPAGGRPQTINDENWQDFLTAAGEPSAKVIVEGANLFLTDGARQQLSQAGVAIVRDSSANKCGVICSSFEIMASMLLSEGEFLEIKDELVPQVIDRLRRLAQREAMILFREKRHKPGISLPELSIRLSSVITLVTDAILSALNTCSAEQRRLCSQLALDYMPPSLRERAGEQALSKLPRAYIDRIVATVLAGKIVYREGLDFFEQMLPEDIARMALRYLEHEQQISALAAKLEASEISDKEQITHILREGGSSVLLRS